MKSELRSVLQVEVFVTRMLPFCNASGKLPPPTRQMQGGKPDQALQRRNYAVEWELRFLERPIRTC